MLYLQKGKVGELRQLLPAATADPNAVQLRSRSLHHKRVIVSTTPRMPQYKPGVLCADSSLLSGGTDVAAGGLSVHGFQ